MAVDADPFLRPQLNLNNRPLSQMLKSSAPAAVVEQDPLEYYEQHTAQIEVVGPVRGTGGGGGGGGGVLTAHAGRADRA